jgi:hypothetical protein
VKISETHTKNIRINTQPIHRGNTQREIKENILLPNISLLFFYLNFTRFLVNFLCHLECFKRLSQDKSACHGPEWM